MTWLAEAVILIVVLGAKTKASYKSLPFTTWPTLADVLIPDASGLATIVIADDASTRVTSSLPSKLEIDLGATYDTV